MVLFKNILNNRILTLCRRSPEIRDWLSIHAPWFDDIIAIAYEENMTYEEFAQKCVKDIKDYFKSLKNPKEPIPCSLNVEDEPVISKIVIQIEIQKV